MNLSSRILQEKWYPRDRPFTEFEARIDFLLFIEGPALKMDELYIRWNWSREDAQALIDLMIEENFVEKYDDESPSQRKAIAQQVINVFNEVFSRKIQLDEQRTRMINARIKEGKKMKPPIGIDQFRAVFEYKKKEWKGTELEKHLTLKTLCAPSHFLDYLEAARADYLKKKKTKKVKDQGDYLPGVLFKKSN